MNATMSIYKISIFSIIHKWFSTFYFIFFTHFRFILYKVFLTTFRIHIFCVFLTDFTFHNILIYGYNYSKKKKDFYLKIYIYYNI
jgi:hypothetical protein